MKSLGEGNVPRGHISPSLHMISYFSTLLPMEIDSETFERFRKRMKDTFNEEMTFEEAKHRHLELLDFFWLLAHKPPEEGEPPYEPPLPPWRQ